MLLCTVFQTLKRPLLVCNEPWREPFDFLAARLDALKKYRAKAQQTVRVERVNVESGGQAVVGDVSQRGQG